MPQGCILSLLLFLLYINGLPEVLLSECKLFTDDVKIYRSRVDASIDFKILQEDLSHPSEWSSSLLLGLSKEKCSVLHANRVHENCLQIGNEALRCDNVLAKAMRAANCILPATNYVSIPLFRKGCCCILPFYFGILHFDMVPF